MGKHCFIQSKTKTAAEFILSCNDSLGAETLHDEPVRESFNLTIQFCPEKLYGYNQNDHECILSPRQRCYEVTR